LFEEISLLSLFVDIFKGLDRIVDHGLCKFWLKFTFGLVQYCEHYFFVVEVRIRFTDGRPSPINDSHLIPHLNWNTDEFWVFNKSLFQLIGLISVNSVIVNRFHKGFFWLGGKFLASMEPFFVAFGRIREKFELLSI